LLATLWNKVKVHNHLGCFLLWFFPPFVTSITPSSPLNYESPLLYHVSTHFQYPKQQTFFIYSPIFNIKSLQHFLCISSHKNRTKYFILWYV